MGKSRLTPVKTTTIPRLELSAAVLAVKLDSTIRVIIRCASPNFVVLDRLHDCVTIHF